MNNKFLTVSALAAALFLGGCGGNEVKNTANIANTSNITFNANIAPTVAPTDTAAKAAVESALKEKGFTDITVEATSEKVILRGSVPADKMTEAVMAAQQAAKRPVENELSKK